MGNDDQIVGRNGYGSHGRQPALAVHLLWECLRLSRDRLHQRSTSATFHSSVMWNRGSPLIVRQRPRISVISATVSGRRRIRLIFLLQWRPLAASLTGNGNLSVLQLPDTAVRFQVELSNLCCSSQPPFCPGRAARLVTAHDVETHRPLTTARR